MCQRGGRCWSSYVSTHSHKLWRIVMFFSQVEFPKFPAVYAIRNAPPEIGILGWKVFDNPEHRPAPAINVE